MGSNLFAPMSREEERRVFAEMRPPYSPDVIQAARDRAVCSVMRMATMKAKQFIERHKCSTISVEDLTQSVAVRLLEFVFRFDPQKTVGRWSSHAYLAMKAAIEREDLQNGYPVRIPPGAGEEESYRYRSGGKARDARAMMAESSIEAVRAARFRKAAGSSLSTWVGQNTWENSIEDSGDHIAESDERDEREYQRSRIKRATRSMSKGSRELIRCYLNNEGSMTKVARKLGVSNQAAYQRWDRTIQEIRERIGVAA